MSFCVDFRRVFKRLFLVLISFIMINSSLMGVHAWTRNERVIKVLYISSYSPSFLTFFEQVDGIRDVFYGENIELDIEFMDSKRFYTEENLDNFYRNLEYKIEKLPPYDALIVGDDNALRFSYEYKDELFKDTPIVFMGINDIDMAKECGKDPMVTGVIEDISLKETIRSALNISKKTDRIVAITDATNSGQGDLKKFYTYEEDFQDVVFDDIDLSDCTFEGFKNSLAELGDGDTLILLSLFKDKDESVVSFEDGVALLVENTDRPIFHPYRHGIERGIVGGKVISHYEQGKKAGELVIDIINGGDVSSMSVIEESPNKYVFDKNVLDKFGFSLSDVPLGSEIINNDLKISRTYVMYGLCMILFIILQLILIIILHMNIKRRKKTEEELLINREKLIDKNRELENMNDELSASLEEIRDQDEKIKDLVYIDAITGLKNRHCISQIIDRAIENKDSDDIMGVIFMDLDNFKNVNDTYGHDVGDRVLKEIGYKLRDIENEYITTAKFAGDEFLLFIEMQKDAQSIEKVINKIQKKLFQQIDIDGRKILLTISFGIALMPDNGSNRTELFRQADVALRKAKDSGRNKYVFFNNEMNQVIEEKSILQEAIKLALKNEEFTLHYQPYVDAKSEKTVGFEALIRWISDKHGFVSPFKLITIAEEMGLMIEIGEWVMREACKFASKINKGRDKPLKVSINISALQLMSNGFYERTMEIIENTGVSPKHINLEMTETILIESFEKGTKVLEKLQSHGIGISLDDFGTGYSSLKYFRELPVNILKIDKSFIDNIETSPYDQKLIRGMIGMANHKNVHVISEGVETKEQLNILKRYGCHSIQGFLFSRPLTEEKSIEYIENMK